jgi:hypothetical protein
MKFKIGDKVRIVGASYGWGSASMGDIGKIIQADVASGGYVVKLQANKNWYAKNKDLELVENKEEYADGGGMPQVFDAINDQKTPTPIIDQTSSLDAVLSNLIDLRIQDAGITIKQRPVIIRDKAEPKEMEGVFPKEFDRIVQLSSQRINTLLVGPTGCGKTYIAEKVAEALDLSFASLSCSAGMSESQLAGWLLPTGEGGKFEYHASPFVNAYENGGVFLLDELDASDSNVVVFINTAIAGNTFHLPQRLSDTKVKRHKDFVLIAAANTHGHGADTMFVGRNQLDAATLSRFKVGTVNMDYSDIVEKSIVHPEVLKWGKKIRTIINDKKLRREMSTRNMVDITKMVDSYQWTEEQWSEGYFSDWSKDDLLKVS